LRELGNLEAFVYCWTDKATNKLYVGSHKGSLDDGYVCSSKLMMQEYKKRPEDFSRQIIAEGEYEDIRVLENKILKAVDARKNRQFYNRHNGEGQWYIKEHTEATKELIKQRHTRSWTGKKHSEDTKKKMSASMKGVKHRPYYGRVVTEESKEKARLAMKNSAWHNRKRNNNGNS